MGLFHLLRVARRYVLVVVLGMAATAGALYALDSPAGVYQVRTATLAGRGVTDGWSAALVNRGGQWTVLNDRPFFDVQAVGPTREAAAANLDAAVVALTDALAGLEDTADVVPAQRMALHVIPAAPTPALVGGRPWPARVAIVLLGAAATATVLAALAGRGGARRRVADAVAGSPLRIRTAHPLVVGASRA